MHGSKYGALSQLERLASVLDGIAPEFRISPGSEPALKVIADATKANFNRVLELAKLAKNIYWKGFYLHLISESIVFRRQQEFQTLKPMFDANNVDMDKFSQIRRDTEVFATEQQAWYENLGPDMGADYVTIEKMFDTKYADGAAALMAALVTSTWTAFESLSGDLWEACLNASPGRLADLHAGDRIWNKVLDTNPEYARSRKDLAEKAKQKPKDRTQENNQKGQAKSFTVEQIRTATDGTFNLNNKIGTLLRSKYDFSILGDIRQAYGAAFWCYSNQIDEALSCVSLDVLSLVRNVVVHNAGKADKKYLDGISGLPGPTCDFDEPVPLDGTILVSLIGPVFTCSANLVSASDKWLQEERNGKYNKTEPVGS